MQTLDFFHDMFAKLAVLWRMYVVQMDGSFHTHICTMYLLLYFIIGIENTDESLAVHILCYNVICKLNILYKTFDDASKTFQNLTKINTA